MGRNRSVGLYDPANEHDACGVAFVADLQGRRSHDVVADTLAAIENLSHRGAGLEEETGDGAGILTQIPDAFFRAATEPLAFDLPPSGAYGVGMVFLPIDPGDRATCELILERSIREAGCEVIGWRDVPHDPGVVGPTARSVMPVFRQVFVGGGAGAKDEDEFERRLYLARKIAVNYADRAELGQRKWFYVSSLSCRTIVYKGMLTARQLAAFYPDLSDASFGSALALAHSRFSTNTFPSWELAHPYRRIAHNGEINTLRGNINWMRAREVLFATPYFRREEMKKILPVIRHGLSDSAILDHVVEFLSLTGRSLPHAVCMLLPEAWEKNDAMEEALRAFYRYHACLVEPWDGPALVAFSDGRLIGAVLDRNGLRPGRYWITRDGRVIFASEVGVLDLPPEEIVEKGRLGPGRIFLVDVENGRLVSDEEVKRELASTAPYGAWLDAHLVRIEDLPEGTPPRSDPETLEVRERLFGYTREDFKFVFAPSIEKASEPIGAMGDDTPLAVLSEKPRLLFDYFKQSFAQVTNPPIDALRESRVTSLRTTIGPEGNLLEALPESCQQVEIPSPILSDAEMEKFRALSTADVHFSSRVIDMTFPVAAAGGEAGAKENAEANAAALEDALERIFDEAMKAVAEGVPFLILSDRGVSRERAPVPSLLATAGLHHHLVRSGARTRVGLVVETGEAREVHHVCLLLGYGAGAVNPYLAFEAIDGMIRDGTLRGYDHATAVDRYVRALAAGVMKVMSKLGISTVHSYRGAQAFEAVGLDRHLVEKYFTGTPSRIGGADLARIAADVARRHAAAYGETASASKPALDVGGFYRVRKGGEFHVNRPEVVRHLQQAVREDDEDAYRAFAEACDGARATLRSLFRFKARPPVPLHEVEPEEEIVKRFVTGAMSYGAISREAHETLAIAMNEIGAASNTGEGGEDAERFGDARNSAVKQVASGRFGVTSAYLSAAKEIQIKIAQGAKPGEGGQLPGKKVHPWIAQVRFATPYVGLISPPPHHDIYSIEDLAQLIHDLKCANPEARVSVKLVAAHGVGTVAAGVVKAKADAVWIAGHDGGTGAAPLTSIRHAGIPWELGLAETQQVLLINRLRDRVSLGVDGGLKTGRDVIVGALLGAETFGFGTAALIALGCIMARVCHLDTCPTGVATQDPRLRERFAGKPEHVIRYMRFVARDVRERMAGLGFRRFEDLVGRCDLLEADPLAREKNLDFTELFHRPAESARHPSRKTRAQDHGLEKTLDARLVELCHDAIEDGEKVRFSMSIRNIHRSVGATLGHRITRRRGGAGLPDETIRIHFLGSAGQSFGAFLPRGVTLVLEGDANDYLGKGLSGGRIAVFPPRAARFAAEANVIAGNVLLYGATGGACFIRGRVGERFAVRNSGAWAVVEGVGDHACEYMTGGRVVVIGPTGFNFAAGMSGGTAYVLDADGRFAERVNREMVDLDPLEASDGFAVRELLAAHWAETESPVAERLLRAFDDDFEATASRFVKVMPKDLKRALAASPSAAVPPAAVPSAAVPSAAVPSERAGASN